MTKSLKLMITAAGAPQASTLYRHLRENGERPVSIVGLDMNPEAYGGFLADSFHVIPRAGSAGYEERILDLVRKESPDALINSSGADVLHIARMKEKIEALGAKVLCSPPHAIETADNKYSLYSTLAKVPGVDVPEFHSPASLDEFVATAESMGYPERDVCFKPHVSKGSRGFRILTERFDRMDLLLNHKPTAKYMSMDEFRSIFKNCKEFPKLVLMEVMDGEEVDVMTIAHKGQALLTTAKSRESNRWGIIDLGELIDRPELVEKTKRIIGAIPLASTISIQFIGGKVLEINPRTSTYIFAKDFNEPWLAVKLALGLSPPEEIMAYQERIPFGRRMVRYMDQMFFNPDGSWEH